MKAQELKRKLKRNLKLAAALGLIIFSVSCATTKLIHVGVGCEGQPEISLNFTHEEANRFTDEMDLKLSVFAVTLRERINTQCQINDEHDRIHDIKY